MVLLLVLVLLLCAGDSGCERARHLEPVEFEQPSQGGMSWSDDFTSMEDAEEELARFLSRNQDLKQYLDGHKVLVKVVPGRPGEVACSNALAEQEPFQITIPFSTVRTPYDLKLNVKYELGHWIYKFEIKPKHFARERTEWEDVLFSHRVCKFTARKGMKALKMADDPAFIAGISSKEITDYDMEVIRRGYGNPFRGMPFRSALEQRGYQFQCGQCRKESASKESGP